MEVWKCWKIVEFPKISIKIKNCKTFYEVQTARRVKEIIQPLHHPFPQPDKILHFWRKKISYEDIQKYTDTCFEIASRMRFLDVKKWCSANAFSDTKQKNLGRKICEVREVFGCVARAYYFQYQVSWFW